MSFRKKSLSTLVSILFVTLCGCNEESVFETVEIAKNPIFMKMFEHQTITYGWLLSYLFPRTREKMQS